MIDFPAPKPTFLCGELGGVSLPPLSRCGADPVRSVLVVDNSRFYTHLIAEHLRERGFDVRDAYTGVEALRAVAISLPDLVILDLVMPQIDGIRVCRYLQEHEHLRSIPVIVVSGLLPEEIDNLRHLGARAFVAKMQMDKLLQSIDQAINWVERGEPETLLCGFDSMRRREVVRELVERLRANDSFLESLSEGVAIANAGGVLVYSNETFARLIGQSHWELLSREAAELFPELLKRGKAPAAEPPSKQGLEIQRGSKTLELRCATIRQKQQCAGTILVLEDITERLQAERDRERLQLQFFQHEKLSSLGRLVSGVAHELHSPLSTVIGLSQLLQGRTKNADIKRPLERVYLEACRCERITQNLIAFGQKQPLIKRRLGLNGILKKVLDVVDVQLKLHGVEVVRELDPKLPLTMVDYDQIQRVFINIINNAQLALRESPKRTLTVRSNAGADRIHIEFQDTGPGVPETLVDKAFEPFVGGREVGQGVGLGLSVSYGIVREHGGDIHLENRPQGGVTVSIELPILAAPTVRKSADSVHKSPQWRVLAVDDQPAILDLLVDLLRAAQHRVDVASSGAEALNKLSSGSFDAIVLDLKMPGMDGRQLFGELEQRFPDLSRRVVFLTEAVEDEETRRFLEKTTQPVLTKPFEIEKVPSAVARLLMLEKYSMQKPAPVTSK